MLTPPLRALSLGASTASRPTPSQDPSGKPYDPRASPAVSIALTGFNLLKQSESEGDEPYLLVYEYGVRIAVKKGVLQKPSPLPIRIVGRGSFDNIRSGYDWGKKNNQLPIRGFSTNFSRQENAYILFGMTVFAFDHDEYTEVQLDALKRVATSFIRTAQDNTLKSDPNALIDAARFPGTMMPSSFSPFTMKNINVMSTGKPDNLAGQRTLVLLSKPLGQIPGTPDELSRSGTSGEGIRPNSVSTFLLDIKSTEQSIFVQDIYRGEIRLTGQIIRHR